MGKQTRSRKGDSVGKGKVTPVQIAFIVDRYLFDNNFSETRSLFRNEASSLISKSPVREAPKTLLSLDAMLNEYICLKEQKVMLDQEKVRLEQEKLRVQTLLQGMQNVMNAYNASGTMPTPMVPASAARSVLAVPQSDPFVGTPLVCPTYRSPTIMPVSTPSNAIVHRGNLSSPITVRLLSRKRAGSASDIAVEAPSTAKKFRNKSYSHMTSKGPRKQCDRPASLTQEVAQTSSVIGSSTSNGMPCGQLVQGSSVAKSLFNHSVVSRPSSSSGPNTPPQAVSPQNDKSASPMAVSSSAHCSNRNSPQLVTPNNCTIITSERVTISPCKHISYTLERNHCIASPSPVKTTLNRLNKRENVKGRLDFDGSDATGSLGNQGTLGSVGSDVTGSLNKPVIDEISTSESDKEIDIFGIEFPDLEAFGADFSFSELLTDLDIGCEGISCACEPTLAASPDTVSGSSNESRDGNQGSNQVMTEFSNVTEVISQKDRHVQGADTETAVKSIKKFTRVLSPAKIHKSSLDRENDLARNP